MAGPSLNVLSPVFTATGGAPAGQRENSAALSRVFALGIVVLLVFGGLLFLVVGRVFLVFGIGILLVVVLAHLCSPHYPKYASSGAKIYRKYSIGDTQPPRTVI